jgi:uncharacterized Ntn-hydrolase superfamily protein
MTFSIAARDSETGDLGVAVESKFPFVGSVVPWVRASAGAIATQAWANVSYGPDGLVLLEQGLDAEQVVERLTSADDGREHRQLGIVDRRGRAAAYTGSSCMDWAGHRTGEGFTCQGNILAGQAVVDAMAEAYLGSDEPFPERLVAALQAGQRAGGDRRGQQGAALYVARDKGSYGGWIDRYIDLRVDDHATPIDELARLLRLHRLYFEPPREDQLVSVDAEMAREIAAALQRVGFYDSDSALSLTDLRGPLEAWAAVENLEEHMVEGERIDPRVLEFLREKAGGA